MLLTIFKVILTCKIHAIEMLFLFARLITNFGKFIFGSLGGLIFFTMVSVCKETGKTFN